MSQEKQPWWESLPAQVGGDVIIGQVGAGATGAAIGKNIQQTVTQILGESTPEDRQVIEEQFAQIQASLQSLEGKIDETTAQMAQFQLKLLQGELSKVEEGETPSATTITQVGDWLLEHVPDIAEALTGLFATPAVGRVVGKAGEAAIKWVRGRFGRS